MRKTAALRVQEALILFNIPLDKQREIMNEAFGMTASAVAKHRKEASYIAQSWVSTLEPLRKYRRTLAGNKAKWPEDMRAIYDSYLRVVDAVLLKMHAASEERTLADETARAALVNARRLKEGQPSLGTRDKRWQSWVPPHIRDQITQDFETAYAKSSRKGGNRMTPFITHDMRSGSDMRVRRIKGVIQSVRDHMRTPSQSGDYAHTPYRALYLAAARQAERALAVCLAAHKLCKSNVYDKPVPVNWTHLLTPEMRQRMRDADRNPDAVSIEGLTHFYYPLPTPLAAEESDNAVAAAAQVHAQAQADEDAENQIEPLFGDNSPPTQGE
jgi:hypothetical protein